MTHSFLHNDTSRLSEMLDDEEHKKGFLSLKSFRQLGENDWLVDPNQKPKRLKSLLTRMDGSSRIMYLPQGIVGLLGAPGGTGKTRLLLQLAFSLATGCPWLERYHPTEPGHVLLLLAEETEELIKKRLWEIYHGLYILTGGDERSPAQKETWAQWRNHLYERLIIGDVRGQNVSMINRFSHRRDGTEHASFFDTLNEQLQTYRDNSGELVKFKCIVLDPLARFMGGDENDNQAGTLFIEQLEKLTQGPGNPTVLVAHHTNKGALNSETQGHQGMFRGASAFVDGARWAAVISPADNENKSTHKAKRLSLVKTNYTQADAIDLVWKRATAHNETCNVLVPDTAKHKNQANPLSSIGT